MAIRELYILIMVSCVSDYEASQSTALETVNVALGKLASISSTYPGSGPASLAVDGNTNTTYASVSSGHANCIHTSGNEHNAWWEVDLGRNYTITNITVYIRESLPARMDYVRITIDGKRCYSFPHGTTAKPPVKNISCTSPVQGRIVRFSRNPWGYYLNFCEVQIWVCRPGLYGKDCESECNCKNNTICDNYYESCTDGCSTGYYGFNCTQKCGRCKVNSICDSTTGSCLEGCQAGWKEPLCFECVSGKYGDNCNQSCGKCKNGTVCSVSNGVCLEGCQDGFKKPLCNEMTTAAVTTEVAGQCRAVFKCAREFQGKIRSPDTTRVDVCRAVDDYVTCYLNNCHGEETLPDAQKNFLQREMGKKGFDCEIPSSLKTSTTVVTTSTALITTAILATTSPPQSDLSSTDAPSCMYNHNMSKMC